MRKVVYAINITLDGCCDHTKIVPDETMFEDYIQLLRDADLFVYGRKTFQLMVPYWPDVAKDSSASKSDRDFGQAFASANKVVFSRSLDDAEAKKGDKKARVVRTNLRDEILKLKQEPGKNILAGGVDIPSQLVKLGLVDEFHFVVHPILAGAGTR
ncbi:MAG TPA: dihydrofolate reductase family protein, partial [Candidatus Acidoferrales bacterium]|nr:dihydrofolate reductase family protein [Candidatus Acidoferrales bacterium]